jgi:hypothetical protein
MTTPKEPNQEDPKRVEKEGLKAKGRLPGEEDGPNCGY